jgi:putative ABC transport system permease protein
LYEGLAFGLLTVGFFLTFRILAFPDLSIEGTFPLGGAVAAALIVSGAHPLLATLAAMAAGAAAGGVTALFNTRLRITALLSGVLMMVGLYSVNLRILGGPNIPMLREENIFDLARNALGLKGAALDIAVAGGGALICFLALNWFLRTEIGLALRASGDNEQMVRGVGSDTNKNILLGCAISNGLIALTGALVAQNQGFADVGMGLGIIVTALAAVIIGEALFQPKRVAPMLLACFAGSFLYRLFITVALRLGMAPGDMKLVTALLVLFALAAPYLRKRLRGEWMPPAERI